jgi:hypothetical protein
MYRGVDGFKMSDVTVGTQAPSSGFDITLSFNTTDANSNYLTAADIAHTCDAFKRWILTNGGSVGGNPITGITKAISGPPG